MKPQVLITGANGFVGQFLGHYLYQQEYPLIHALRNEKNVYAGLAPGKHCYVGDIDAQTDWSPALKDTNCIIHLAARVHVMQETVADPLSAFQATNLHATINLADQAIRAGVKRFIYLSTIKVNGEKTDSHPFQADDSEIELAEPYSISKLQAEQALLERAKKGLIEVVIIRPPLVYGPSVKGNFLRLIRLVKKQLPMPLAKIQNQRSLVSVHNLSSLIHTCLEHPKATGEVFLVSDGEDLSTSELFSRIAKALNCNNRLFYLPYFFLKYLSAALGKSKEFERLFGSLQVDIEKNIRVLDWRPQVSIDQALRETVKDYKSKSN